MDYIQTLIAAHKLGTLRMQLLCVCMCGERRGGIDWQEVLILAKEG